MSLLAAAVLLAPAVGVAPIGDGGGRELTFENRSVHRVEALLGVDGDGVRGEVEGYGQVRFFVQCAGDESAVPPVSLRLDGKDADDVVVPAVGFPEGPPAIWISTRREGRAALDEVVEGYGVTHLAPAEVPARFAALRFAPLVLINVADLAELTPAGRDALQGAVAAGVTLVIAAGEAGGAAEAVRTFTEVGLGEVRRPGPALGAALSRVSGARELRPGPGVSVLLSADGAPVVTDVAFGLGRVRVLATALLELEKGEVARAAFADGSDGLSAALAWAAQAPPLAHTPGAPLNRWVWLLLLGVPLLGLVSRLAPRVALGLAAPLLVAAVMVPPAGVATVFDAARVLYVPYPGGALAVGTLDLTLERGGRRLLPSDQPTVSVDEVTPGAACVVAGDDGAAWVVAGEPGERRRLLFFATLAAAPDASPGAARLPEWPAGPLAGAHLDEVSAATAPLPLAERPAQVSAWRLRIPAPPANPPPALPAPKGG